MNASTSPEKLVSVIIPAFNAERHLAAAIESILAQDYRPLEIIVVDDGSTDRTAEIAESFGDPVRCVRQANGGTAVARNVGVQLARGEYLAHHDADDLWTEGRLSLQVRALETHPDMDAASGYVRSFYSPELAEDERQSIRCPEQPIPGHVAQATLMRRGSYDLVGPSRAQWVVGSDLDWYLRAKEAGFQLLVLPAVVLLRRLHGSNKGRVEKERLSDRLRVLKEALDRRRAASGQS